MSSQDMILTEMLKTKGANLLLHVFNKIDAEGTFPRIWSTSILWPLHKEGPTSDPQTFRAISIGSYLCELFCSFLYRRLAIFVQAHSLIPECQIRFKPGCRTADHMFALRIMVDKYVRCVPNGRLYVCFVDFRNPFLSVCRNALFYKLPKRDIGEFS